MMLYDNDTVRRISDLNKIIIYGAGTMGRALKLCLESDVYKKRVEAFLVKSLNNNPQEVGGTPVVTMKDFDGDKNAPIIVALNEKNILTALKELKEAGFTNLIELNAAADSWQYIKARYFMEKKNLYLPFEVMQQEEGRDKNEYGRMIYEFVLGKYDSFVVYVARSIYDKKIREKCMLAPMEREIQGGAALTNKEICHIKDNTGDNISAINRKYCELTALYWLWKNDKSDYVGLSHYRRRFCLDVRDVKNIRGQGIDVVVTMPVIVTRGIGRQYSLDHGGKDWDIMLDVIHRLCPVYDNSVSYVQEQQYFFAYNMFIMRRTVLAEYCQWLFPILFACAEIIGEKDDTYQNRYAGFLAERLLNVFLYHNRERLKIAVVKRHYLE